MNRLLKFDLSDFSLENFNIGLETILIIVAIVFLPGAGGWYWRRGALKALNSETHMAAN